jgi:hypothetical protein
MEQTVVASEGQPLSQVARFVDTFIAPSKTFNDIRRNASWWLPFVLTIIVSIFFATAVGKQVGWDTIAHQNIEKNHFAADRISSLPKDQQAAVYAKSAQQTKVVSYAFPVLGLIFALIFALLWWASLNFGLGARTKYSQILAVVFYAGLPKLLIYVLATVLLFAGVGLDNFDMQNPAGTNVGYYLPATSPALRAAGSFFDIFGLWALALAVLGTAIVAEKKPSQTAIVVVGWWIIGLLLVTAAAAITA